MFLFVSFTIYCYLFFVSLQSAHLRCRDVFLNHLQRLPHDRIAIRMEPRADQISGILKLLQEIPICSRIHCPIASKSER